VVENVIIIGDGEFADIAHDYFTHDSSYNVVAFAVEKNFYKKKFFCDKPVIFFEDIKNVYPPSTHKVFVAISATKLNRVRRRLFLESKKMGYKCVSYVSSQSFVWSNVSIGENVFIFEANVLQSNVVIGDNCILWSGNHIGHRSTIKNHVFISSHCVISGFCTIHDNCFLGVNATIADNVKVSTNNIIGAGAIILRNTLKDCVYKGDESMPSKVSSLKLHRLKS